MSEAELLRQANDWLNAGVDSITLYLSVLFAYFVVAHLVGKSLSRLQLWIIAPIYCVIMISGLVAIYTQFSAVAKFLGELKATGSIFVPKLPEHTQYVVVGIYALAFLASHYYMHVCRKRKADLG